jgi:hypothetical protein
MSMILHGLSDFYGNIAPPLVDSLECGIFRPRNTLTMEFEEKWI